MNKNSGLSSREASKRLDRFGPNTVVKTAKLSWARAYLARFRNPLVIILLFAAVLSLFLDQIPSAVIIITIVLISTTLDFVNTYRSEQAAANLQKSVRVSAQVIRDKKVRAIALSNIVPGDIVALEAGSLIPADGKVVDSNEIAVDESTLTGESYPQIKSLGADVYMGSSVVSGSGHIMITATGQQTEFAHVAASLQKQTPTEFDREIAHFSALIARITFLLVLFILTINLVFHRDAISSLLFAVALAVGLTPELLPLIITINLTKGSLRMARHGVIVKKLSAMQNFGSMDILCTDKTGTLTQNQIAVARTQDYNHTESRRTLELAAVVCKFSTAYESPLDVAVLSHRKYNLAGYKKVQEIPFDFQRKRESVVARVDADTILITKGAADEILKIISSYRDKNGEARHLTDAVLARLKQDYSELSSEGYRVLAVTTRDIPSSSAKPSYDVSDEAKMTFEGFIAFIDPPKSTAAKSIRDLETNGIEVKIITGDDPLVSQKVADELKINVKGIMTGEQIAKLNRLQLARRVEDVTIFARVNPSQKLAVIEALRQRGHVVGYMGDGINDAPSLRAADIGISVNNAVDVAKDTADMILMGKSLSYLNDGVIEGRRTFANTLKYLKMSLSSNFGNMFSMAGASIFLPYLPMTAPQILFNNLLYDASQFAIPADNVDEDQLRQPRRMDMKSIKHFMWVFGPLSSVFDFITFGVLLLVFHATAGEFQTGWFIESLLTQTLVVFLIRSRHFALKSRPARALMLSVTGVILVALAVIFSSLGHYFGFVIQPTAQIIAITLIVFTYLVIVELVKHWFYKKQDEKAI